MPSASEFSDGLDDELNRSSDLGWIIELYDPRSIMRAVMSAYSKWMDEGKKPGADKWIFGDGEDGAEWHRSVMNEWLSLNPSRKACDTVEKDDFYFPVSVPSAKRLLSFWRRVPKNRKAMLYKAWDVPAPRSYDERTA